MYKNPALLGLKRYATPLVLMFYPIFCAHISCSEFQYFELILKVLCGIMVNLVAEIGVIRAKITQSSLIITRTYSRIRMDY